MTTIFTILGLFFWFGTLSAMSGRSLSSVFPSLGTWQDKRDWFSEVPEGSIALSFGGLGTWGIYKLFSLSWYWLIPIFIVFTVISYAGKQSATFVYLRWYTHTPKDFNRQSSTRPFNDFLGKIFGFRYGDEGYTWIWAFTKGLMTTFPCFSLGAIFQPLCRELASHAKGRLPYDSNFWMEFLGDGLTYAVSSTLYIWLIIHLTS